jgi:hypothetical protein
LRGLLYSHVVSVVSVDGCRLITFGICPAMAQLRGPTWRFSVTVMKELADGFAGSYGLLTLHSPPIGRVPRGQMDVTRVCSPGFTGMG